MTLVSFNVHNIRTIRARRAQHADGRWIDIYVNNEDEEVITLFFASRDLAIAIADAINVAAGHASPEELASVGDILTDAGIVEATESPIPGVQAFQFKDLKDL